VAQLAATTGASMLYSAARQYLLLASRTPWGQLSQPTMSFANVSLAQTHEPD